MCAITLSMLATPAFADQFILFDATFDYTWDDAINSTPSQSHYYVTDESGLNLERPVDWVAPVNYRDGSVHIRVEVLAKPEGDQEVGWALCYIANQGAYGCPYSDYYTGVGVVENDVAMSDFWKSGAITWEAGVKQVDLVYTINSSGNGHVHKFPDLATATTPTSVRITMVQVSQGDTYDPSILADVGPGTGGAGSGGDGALPSSGGGTATGGDSGETGGTAGVDHPATPGDSTSSEAGGCSVSATRNQGGLSVWIFLAVGVAGALFRARRGQFAEVTNLSSRR